MNNFSPLHANAWNKNKASGGDRRLQTKETGWRQKRSVSEWAESWMRTETKLWVKKKKKHNRRVVPLLSTHPLHTSSSSSSPLPLSRWLMKLPQHRLIPQSSHWSIRPLDSNYSCGAGAGERRALPVGCRRRLRPDSLAPSKLTQINSDTQT